MQLQLINRPSSISNESLQSYIFRLGQANYYDERNWIIDLLELPRETHVDFVCDRKKLERFAKFLLMNVDDVAAMTVHKYAPAVIGKKTWDETGRNLFLAGTKAFRVCPKCFLETGAKSLPWLLRPVTVCKTHGIILMDTCSACGEKLSGDSCRKCGLNISEMEFAFVDEESIGRHLADRVWDSISGDSDHVMENEEFPFSQMTTQQFFFLLWKMGTLILEYDSKNSYLGSDQIQHGAENGSRRSLRELSVQEYHQVLITVMDALSDWPNRWYLLLGRVLEAEEARRNLPAPTWKRKTFPYALSRVVGSEPALRWLWTGFLDFVHKDGGKSEGMEYWIRYMEKDFRSEMDANLPVRPNPDLKVENNLDLTDVFGFDQAMGYLNVSRSSLQALIQRGLVIPDERREPTARTKWVFKKEHLDNVLEHLIGGLDFLDIGDGDVVFLGYVSKYVNHAGLQWMDVLSAIQMNEFGAYRQPPSRGLNSVWVYKEQLQNYVQRLKERKPISIYAAMKILQCGVETLIHLANAGLLFPCSGYPGKDVKTWKYTLDGLEKFKQRYIGSDEAADIAGFSARTILTWTQKGWIDAVSGPTIDGCYQYRFDRENLIQWRYDRILSRELLDLLGISQRTMEAWVAKGKLVPMDNMPKHPYWFDRKDVEDLSKREHRLSAKVNVP